MPRGAFVPRWQRAVVVLSSTVLFTVVVLAMYFARPICLPIALAIFASFVLSPVVVRLQRRGLGRGVAVVLVVFIALTLGIGSATVLTHEVVRLSEEAAQPEHAENFKRKITEGRNALTQYGSSKFGQLIDDVSAIISPSPAGETKPVLVTMQTDSLAWLVRFESYLSPTAQILGQAALTFVLTIFALLHREDLRNRVIRLTGHGRVTTTTKALDDVSQRISNYLLAQLIVNASFGCVIALAMYCIGLKLALLWGSFALVMRYVPYVGTWIALIPPAVFSLALSEGWWQPITVIAIFISLELVCSNFVEPLVYGRSMGVSGVAQLVAAAFWAFLWGPIGLILSGPLTVCLLVLGKHVGGFEFFDILLGDEPVLEPFVIFYQRLTARDQDEASQLAHRSAGEIGTVGVFDAILVPAMCLAKRDCAAEDCSPEEFVRIVHAAGEVGEEVIAEHPPEATRTDHRVRVLLCPARDEGDHAAIELLAATLDPGRWDVEVAATEMLASELLIRIETQRPAALVIGSLPPGDLSHTRYLVARVRRNFPDLKIIVGRWGRGGVFLEEAAPGCTGADWMDATLAETHKRLTDWFAVLAAQGPQALEKSAG